MVSAVAVSNRRDSSALRVTHNLRESEFDTCAQRYKTHL